MADKKHTLPFFGIVQKLEGNLGGVTGLDLMELLSPSQYLALRKAIVDSFELSEPVPDFDEAEFGEEVEIGDVSDAVRETTFARYPQTTPMDKPISEPERRSWCLAIIDDMDDRARNC